MSLLALIAVMGSSEVYGMEGMEIGSPNPNKRCREEKNKPFKPHKKSRYSSDAIKKKDHFAKGNESHENIPGRLVPLGVKKLGALIRKANKGDIRTQKKLIVRNYLMKLPDLPQRHNTPQLLTWETVFNYVGIDDRCDFFILQRCTEEEIRQHFPALFENIKRKAEEGNPRAQANLGRMYSNGQGVEGGKCDTNNKLAVYWYTKAAEQGDAPAQNNLGVLYQSGVGVKGGICDINDKLAVNWYKEAAKQGHVLAQNNLGSMYLDGRGVEGRICDKNDKLACRWYKKAAKQGNVFSQSSLGWMHLRGRGVEGRICDRNNRLARKWYKRGARQGDAICLNELGEMYQNGLGVEGEKCDKNDKIAFKLYTKAANQGNADAQFNLGWMYACGKGMSGEKSPHNDTIVFKLFLNSAYQGKAEAQNSLGLMYQNGLGVAQNAEIACYLYIEAAKQDLALAQNNLGWMYQNGSGVEKNPKIAFDLYTKAAMKGLALAQTNVGWAYENGCGVDKDVQAALHWYMTSKSKPNILRLFPMFFNPNPSALVSEGPFQELVEDLQNKIEALLGSHYYEAGLHNPESRFPACILAIPKLYELYQQIVEVETEALQSLKPLCSITPGFMISTHKTKPQFIPQLPLVHICKAKNITYLNFGEKNGAVVRNFLDYITKIDQKFVKAENAINEVLRYYTLDLELATSKLVSLRSCARKNEDEKSLQKFNKQKEKVNELESNLRPYISETKRERGQLREIKNGFHTLLKRGVGQRNREFLEEYPYLRPQ